jgi:hypothetical protein
MYHGTGNPYLLRGSTGRLGYVAGSALFYDFGRGTWTNAEPLNGSDCLIADGERFWAGSKGRKRGLFSLMHDPLAIESWLAPTFVQSPMNGLIGNGIFTSNAEIGDHQLEQAETAILNGLKKFEATRDEAHAARTNSHVIPDPFQMTARIPGDVEALANDGDYLWLGVNNYFGSYLLLLHKPSRLLVAGHTKRVRERISSLTVSDQFVWVGTAYGDNTLLRMNKSAFRSVPENQWVSLTITPEERSRAVQGMSKPDQALYAFLAGDDAKVVQLLGDADPQKTGLQEMLLLAWSYDASGVDDSDKCRVWFDRIKARYPDSPWAKYAAATVKANDAAHAAKRARTLALTRFDLNRDGQLDATETRAMNRDSSFAKVQAEADELQLRHDMELVVKRYDEDRDGRLLLLELEVLQRSIRNLVTARKELPHYVMRNRYFEPLLAEQPPAAVKLIALYDANRDGALDAAELVAWAQAIHPKEAKR